MRVLRLFSQASSILVISSLSLSCCSLIHSSRELSSSWRMAAAASSTFFAMPAFLSLICSVWSVPSTEALRSRTSLLREMNWLSRSLNPSEKMSHSGVASLPFFPAAWGLSSLVSFSICLVFLPISSSIIQTIIHQAKIQASSQTSPILYPLPSFPLFSDSTRPREEEGVQKIQKLHNYSNMEEEGEHISGPMTIISIVNGMIGGFILILPVMALDAGWLLTLIVLLITGFVSYYSCHLCLEHTGNEADLDISIQKHFWGSRRIRIFYELCIISALLLLDILYYQLIVLQWIGLIPPHQYTPLNPFVNAILLFIIVIVIKFKDFGVSLMAYGIVSIGAYLLFITWVVGSEEPKNDEHSLQMFGGSGIDLASGLGQAFAIQAFFIPVMKKNKKAHKHKLYLLIVFILGTFAYAYIAFMGSYGILHREYLETDPKITRTIEGYFQKGTWEVNAIQVIYLVHLYSVFPEYLLLSKKRFFSIFKLQESRVGTINRSEILYIIGILGFSMSIALARASIKSIIELNGAVLGFFFIYCFPVFIHLRCAFMKQDKLLDKPKEEPIQNYNEMIEEKEYKKDEPQEGTGSKPQIETENKFQLECANSDDKEGYRKSIETVHEDKGHELAESRQSPVACKVSQREVSKYQSGCELVILSFMLLLGFTIMVKGLAAMFMGE